jgi:hypothetical protein
MRTRYLATFTILASICWLGSAGAESLSSKLGAVVFAAADAQSQTNQSQPTTAAPGDATEREALTAEARDAASQALKRSRVEQRARGSEPVR